jgi:hypothetical protein
MEKYYTIKIKENIIGTTIFEYADPPMGVVQGKIIFDKNYGFDYIANYAEENHIVINNFDKKEKTISIQTIDELKVYSEEGTEIIGQGNCIYGDSNELMLDLVYIPYPFYEEEFPHHCKEYAEKYK